MSKKNLKNSAAVIPAVSAIVPVAGIASQAQGFAAIKTALLGEAKASGAVTKSLKGQAEFMVTTYGLDFATDKESKVYKDFTLSFNDTYKDAKEKAKPELQAAFTDSKKGTYRNRLYFYACNFAVARGDTLSNSQTAVHVSLARKYGGKKEGAAMPEKRSYSRRMSEELSAMYKFHMAQDEHGTLTDKSVASIGQMLEQMLRIFKVDPASLTD